MIGVGLSLGEVVCRQGAPSGPPGETLVRTYVGMVSNVGDAIPCSANVGELIVVYVMATVPEVDVGLVFNATWNGVGFTVTAQPFSSGTPAHDLLIATLRVPTGKAGTYDILPSWDEGDEPDAISFYAEKWTGVTSGTADRTNHEAGWSTLPSSGTISPSVNHILVLCAVGRAGVPAVEGDWAAGLTAPAEGHVHASAHLRTAYEIQTVGTTRAASIAYPSLGYWGAVIVMMKAQ